MSISIGQDVINMPIKQQPKADFHPCPKEVNFWTHLQSKFIDEGDRVIDIFLGSGTTAISSHILKCDFVGCELDTDYYNAMMDRFENETRQMALL